MAEHDKPLITEEGIPYEPSATVFREAILDGKSPEDAEYIARLVGEARADTIEAYVKHKAHLLWGKIAAWIGGLLTMIGTAIMAYGTDKVNLILAELLR